MDQDGSLNISFDEWRDFLLLAPSHDIHQLIKYWRHSTVSRPKKRLITEQKLRYYEFELSCQNIFIVDFFCLMDG